MKTNSIAIGMLTGFAALSAVSGGAAEDGYVVWSDSRNGDWDIYGRDLGSGVEKAICVAPGDQQHPKVYKRKVVWASDAGGDADIYVHDLDTDETRVIGQRSAWQDWPEIWGEKVVWIESGANTSGDFIQMYDLATGTETNLAAGPFNFVKLFGDKVAWNVVASGGGGPIMMGVGIAPRGENDSDAPGVYCLDLSTGIRRHVYALPTGAMIEGLALSSTHLAWQEEAWDETAGAELSKITICDLETSARHLIAQDTTERFDDLDPQEEIRVTTDLVDISGDVALLERMWSRYANSWGWWPCVPSHWYIEAYDIPSQSRRVVLEGTVVAGVRVPHATALSFNKIMWWERLPMSYGGGERSDRHIYMYDMSTRRKTAIRTCSESQDTDFPDVYFSPVSGRVAFPDGTPIRGATVLLVDTSGEEAVEAVPVERRDVTDTNGVYRMADLVDGSYNLTAHVVHGATNIYNYRSRPDQPDVVVDDASVSVVEDPGATDLDIGFPAPLVLVHGILDDAAGWASTIDYLHASATNGDHQGYLCYAVEGMHTGKTDSGWPLERNALQIKRFMEDTVLPSLRTWTGTNLPAMNLLAHSQGGAISRCFVDMYGGGFNLTNLVMFSAVNGGVYRLAHVHAVLCPRFLDVMKVSWMYKFNGGQVGGVPAPKHVDQHGVQFHYIAACGATAPSRFMEPSPNDSWVYWASAIAENGPISSLQGFPLMPGWKEFKLRMRDTEFGAREHRPALYPDRNSKGEPVVHTSMCHDPDVLDAALYWLGDRVLTGAGQEPYGLVNWAEMPDDPNHPAPAAKRARRDAGADEGPASAGVGLHRILPGEVQTHRVTLDAEGETVFFLSCYEGDLDFSLIDPDGQPVTPSTPGAGYSHERVDKSEIASGETGEILDARIYSISNPVPGEWALVVAAGALPAEGIGYQAGVFFGDAVRLSLQMARYWAKTGEELTLRATLSGPGLSGVAVVALLTQPDGSVVEVPLQEDGQGGYAGSHVVSQSGRHTLVARATGLADGQPFERTAPEIPVVEAVSSDEATLMAVAGERTRDDDGDGYHDWLEIEVPSTLAAAGDYLVSSRLVDTNGNEICFNTADWLERPAGEQSLVLRFSGRTLVERGVDGPYALTDVWLYRLDDNLSLLDHRAFDYVTAAYSANSFDGPDRYVSGRIVNPNSGIGMAGVTVMFEGAGSAVTSEDGSFRWIVPHGWNGNVVYSYGQASFSPATQAVQEVYADLGDLNAELSWGGRDPAVAISGVEVSGAGGGATISWESGSGLYCDLYSSDDAYSGTMNWTRRVSGGPSGWTPGAYADDQLGDAVMRRFYALVLAGEPVSTGKVAGVIRREVGAGYTLISPPLRMDRRVDGELGNALKKGLQGGSAEGDEVVVLETNGLWRTLHLDESGIWRESDGEESGYELPEGQGLWVARRNAASSARLTFTGTVGNDGTGACAVRDGWNVLGLSEGRELPLKQTLATADPAGAASEEQADLLAIQKPDGAWRRLMHIQGWGEPFDGNWFDLQDFSVVSTNEVLLPGAAYYYLRRGAGADVLF